MRTALAFVIVLGIAAGASAQTMGLPLPSIGLPLPEIGLPLPSLGLPPAHVSPPSSPRSTPPPAAAHRPADHGHATHGARTFVYFVPAYGWPASGSPLPGPPEPPETTPPPQPTGRLSVELQPGVDPQMFVDGYYVATLADAAGELVLAPGVHRLELRADGYEPLVLDIQIVADRTTRYHGLLTALAQPPAAARETAPPPPATIYMIPGCYVGNLPPTDVTLPAGCDPNHASVFPSRR